MKTLIKNAQVIDGTGAPAFQGCVLTEGERILDVIHGDTVEGNFDSVIDAKGQVVCPGFIDSHSHSDLLLFRDKTVPAKVRQGVTTELLGQDGISAAPMPREYESPWRKNLAGLDGDVEELDWSYETTDGYLSLLEKNGSTPNEAYLVPHGNVRMEVLGLDNVKGTDDDLKRMQDVLRRDLEAGGAGLSTGLIYMPCAYSDTREMIALCKAAAEFDRPLVIHQRSEADTILESMEEVITMGRESGVKVHFSHFKVCGKNNADKYEKVLALLDKCKEEGIRVSFDQYPYVAGSTMLGVILPPWAHDGGTDRLLERLGDRDARRRMVQDIEKGIQGWDNFVQFAGLDGIFVTDVKSERNQDCIGKNLVELGELRGKDPYEATFDLLLQEDNAVGMVDFYGLEEHVEGFMRRPEMNVCTDGLLGGKPHPRVFGAFPRVLGRYVRERKALSLEDAVHKMTGRTASVFSFEGRGVLAPGNFADIVVFDPDTIEDKGTFTDPCQYPVGISHVLINGEHVVENGEQRDTAPGKVIRL
ncbi:N-acyl-D-amino-acid deacylase family protein [Desulfobaculum bizertense]|uniref:N-acyl-D-amino-acid deacylase n=1 Tax=Desulfobaculum bizertense DSM 18034 TaxID=1121442 RepID=A0A1T4W511_9BACT|nr:D-aminoacylase [Desulfobaculum bizertense]UIJ38637.1 D-aminoacylase [Desulfobaculum bizertense]SKA72332.1 N-acyl-D-amino-acid deacylase [Desulfobaculum bizertense DSM 18034]